MRSDGQIIVQYGVKWTNVVPCFTRVAFNLVKRHMCQLSLHATSIYYFLDENFTTLYIFVYIFTTLYIYLVLVQFV